MESLHLIEAVYHDIVAHAKAALPAEAVGLLGGNCAGLATVVFPLPNLGGLQTFFADPYAQFMAEKAMRRVGLRPLAVYHSHPGGGPQLSALDLAFAGPTRLIQLVVALERSHLPGVEVRAFRVVGNVASEITVTGTL